MVADEIALQMPIKAVPYEHQLKAYQFACEKFGLITEGGDFVCHDKSEMQSLREGLSKEKD